MCNESNYYEQQDREEEEIRKHPSKNHTRSYRGSREWKFPPTEDAVDSCLTQVASSVAQETGVSCA